MFDMDLNDGLTTCRLGKGTEECQFCIDLVGWVKWYTEVSEKFSTDPYALLDAVRTKLRADNEVEMNYSQADAFLHRIMLAYTDLKKKQQEERTCLNSTDSTPLG